MDNHDPIASVFSLSDLSRRGRITIIVLRILTLVVAATIFVMGIAADRSYMIPFSGGLIIISLIPEVSIEMLFRDFSHSGVYNLSHNARLIISPLIYAVVCAVSPLLFHGFFNLFAASNRTMGGNTASLQLGLWRTLCSPPPTSFPFVLIIVAGAIFLLFIMFGLCYLTLSKSKWRGFTAIILFILIEAAAALAACNSPG